MCVHAWTASRTVFGERRAFEQLVTELSVDIAGSRCFQDHVVLSNTHGALVDPLALRLGLVGPLRAQRLLFALHPVLDAALKDSSALGSDDAYAVAPLLDVPTSRRWSARGSGAPSRHR